MNKINRRKFLEKGIASGMGIVIGSHGLISKLKTSSAHDKIRIGVTKKLPENKSIMLGASESREVPDWLHCPRFYTSDYRRVQLMDEAWISKAGDMATRVKKIADNSGSVFRLGVSWGGEVYYQSKIAPHSPRLGNLDYLREALEQGRKSGVKIVAYMNPNSIYYDSPLLEKFGVRNNQGKIWDVKAYGESACWPCINNPDYRKFLLDILREIFTEYKPDGLYVDGLTPHVCFCEYCKAKYREMFNAELPAKFQELGPFTVLWEMTSQPELVGDPRDPDSQVYTQFLYQSLIDITHDFTTTVKSCKPDAVTLFHSWPKAETIQYYDGTLGEIYINQPWVHTLWKSGELTNYGAVFPGLLLLQNMYPQQKTEVMALHKMYQVLANGMLPNQWYFLGMKTCYDFLRDNEQYYDYTSTRPVKFMAFPRAIHNDSIHKRIEKDYSISGPRDRFLAPYVGFFSAMLRSGLPIVTIHRPDFHEKLAGFKVLCLVNEADITDQQAEAVRQFVADGGGLIATGETSLYDQKGQRRPDFALKDLFGASYVDTLAAGKMNVEFEGLHDITKGLEKYRFDYDEPIVVVKSQKRKTEGWLIDNNKKIGNIPAVITNTYGRGRVVYIPARLDSIQCEKLTPAIEQLFSNSVYWVTQGNVPVQINADKTVGVTLFDQPKRRMLHLVNYNADTIQDYERVEPVYNVKIRMSIPDGRKIARLHLLWQKSELKFDNNGKWAEFTLPELGEYEVVVAEFKSNI